MALDYDNRNVIDQYYDQKAYIKKSPLIEGFVAGAKAAAIGVPVGMLFQAFQGKAMLPGAILGAILPGAAAGLVAAGEKKLHNLDNESLIRYHADQIKSREPMFFMPQRPYADRRRG